MPYFAEFVVYSEGRFNQNKSNFKRWCLRNEGAFEMTARERALAVSPTQKQGKNPEYFEQLGIHISIERVDSSASERSK